MAKLLGKELNPNCGIYDAICVEKDAEGKTLIPGLKDPTSTRKKNTRVMQALRRANVPADKQVDQLTKKELEAITDFLDIPAARVMRVRVSASKARRVMQLIKGKKVDLAMQILKNLPHKSARMVEKLLKSVIANADKNYELDVDTLYVKRAVANQSTTMKRILTRSMGRANRLLKRSANLEIILKEKSEE